MELKTQLTTKQHDIGMTRQYIRDIGVIRIIHLIYIHSETQSATVFTTYNTQLKEREN